MMNPIQQKQPGRWLALVMAYLLMLALAVTIQSLPPALPLVIASEKLSHTQAGLLMSLFSLAGAALSMPAGLIADRYGQKRVGMTALALVVIGIAVLVSSHSFPLLALGRALSGAGGTTLMVLASRILPQWFSGSEQGTAYGILNTAMPMGLIATFNAVPLIADRFTWRAGMGAVALVPLAALLVLGVAFRPAHPSGRTGVRREGLRAAFAGAGMPIWLVGLSWMCFNASVVALFTFTPDLLKSSGFSLTQAGRVASVVMWPGLVVPPLVGYFIGRFGRKEASVAIGAMALGASAFFVPQTTSFAVGMMVLVGTAMTLVPPPVYALASEVTPANRHGLGFGILSTCATMGMMLGPLLAGLARDASGSYRLSYGIVAGFGLMCAALIAVLWRVRKRHV